MDSDDWVDEEALLKILSAVKGFVDADSKVDMLISNYVYEKVGMTHKKVIHYRNVLPQNQVFRWDDIEASIWISISHAFRDLPD